MTFGVDANDDPEVIRIFIVRHGQTDHNVKKILQGHIDIDLNATGVQQAKLVASVFKDVPLDSVLSSDLIRCQNTTKEIIEYHPKLSVTYTPNFRERDMGKVQGMYLKDALEKYGENFRNLGEPKENFLKRVDREFMEFIGQQQGNRNAIVCTHGGVITAYTNYLHSTRGYKLKDGLKKSDLKVPFNTSVTTIDVNKSTGDGIILNFGRTGHLGSQLEVKDQLLR